jgi:electron transport complex protein RnfB
MDSANQIYRDLQKHLDKSPVGFPATTSGADIRILKHLFTPREASIAIALSTIRQEPARVIHARIKKSGMSLTLEELQRVLSEMMRKGTILAYKESCGETSYKNAGVTAGGMYDFQVNRLTQALIDDFHQYHSESFARVETTGTIRVPQLRTIPVEKSLAISGKYRTSTYDNVRYLVEKASGPLAVVNCICRQTKDLEGNSCKYTGLRETCLQIGADHARQYVEMGIARFVTKKEAFDMLDQAQQAGLILQPENSRRPEAICCCCGDCCGLLSAVIKSPRPADLYATNYYVEIDPRICNGCGTCVKRCQLEAVNIVDKIAVVNFDRCIGCGNCVTNCQSGANRLVKKKLELVPPKDKDTLYMNIMSRKIPRWSMLKLRTRMLLRLRV